MANQETPLMHAIREAVALTRKATLWRNNTGFASAEKVVYGLGKGSPDLFGFVHGTARVFAIEVKTSTGRLSPEQRCWLRAANSNGAYACVARTPQEAIDHLYRAIEGKAAPEIPEPKPRKKAA